MALLLAQWALVYLSSASKCPLQMVLRDYLVPTAKDGPAGPENRGDPEAYDLDFARLGYVTICPDHPVAGEPTTPDRASHDTTELDPRYLSWSRVGLSAWDMSRAVDFLLRRR